MIDASSHLGPISKVLVICLMQFLETLVVSNCSLQVVVSRDEKKLFRTCMQAIESCAEPGYEATLQWLCYLLESGDVHLTPMG